MNPSMKEMTARVRQEARFVGALLDETRRVIVGQDRLISRMLIALLANGHILIEGVPGLAKTLAVRTLSATIDADFKRIQFTPDLLPSDVIGTQIYNPANSAFEPRLGPIFSQIILADEINRAPAKVQSALLEAMEERQVTLGDETHRLSDVFMVLATQNPVEQEGTYPLPEAQLDRFMMKVVIGYPTRKQEREIINRMGGVPPTPPEAIINADVIRNARATVQEIYVDDRIKDYVLDLIFATRYPDKSGLDAFAPFLEFGASPRGSLWLIKGAKAHAFLKGRGYVTPDDVKAIFLETLRHRVLLSFEAQAEGISSDDVLGQIINQVAVP